MTIDQALADAARQGLERLDAQLLLLQVLGPPATGRAWLLAHGDAPPSAPQQEQFQALTARRAAGEPLAYITGQQEFFGLALRVDARVLVPRPDTETLVTWALDVLTGRPEPTVIDLGTGSGAVALAIQHQRPDARVTGTDTSLGALAVAHANASRLALPVRLRRSDWLADVQGEFDLIVSNPPYIAEGDPHLPALAHEPGPALTAGQDGLADLRTIIRQAPAYLNPGGWLLLEHGYNQAEAVQALLRAAGFGAVGSRHDLAGIARCSGGQHNPGTA